MNIKNAIYILIASTSLTAAIPALADYDNYYSYDSTSTPTPQWFQANKFYIEGDVSQTFKNKRTGNHYDWANPIKGVISAKYNIKNSMAYGLQAGYSFLPMLRTAISYDYINTGINNTIVGDESSTTETVYVNGQMKSNLIMANTFLDFGGINSLHLGRFDPYIGIGAGLAINQTSDVNYHRNNYIKSGFNANIYPGTANSFAWQALAGVRIALTQNFLLDLGYKYIDAGSVATGDIEADHWKNLPSKHVEITPWSFKAHFNEATVGLVYQF